MIASFDLVIGEVSVEFHPTWGKTEMSLEDYGWSLFFSEHFRKYEDAGLSPGRISAVYRGFWLIQSASAELRARTVRTEQAPAVGDWVAWRTTEFGTTLVEALLPRKSVLLRKCAGRTTHAQVVAANVDTAFLVMGLDGDFNPRRLERLLTMTFDSGALPVVVLNKADLSVDSEKHKQAIERLSPGTPVLLVSGLVGTGVDALRSFLRKGETIVLIGSSGAGKSTIINRLFGKELMPTGEVRAGDDRGRHTTTHRQLFKHPDGGLLIDNPGIREIQLWASEESVTGSFDDIQSLAVSCRFRDCFHETEPGCAVLSAVRNGVLSEARLRSYHKLLKEVRYLALKQDVCAQRELKRKWKIIHKALRHNPKS